MVIFFLFFSLSVIIVYTNKIFIVYFSNTLNVTCKLILVIQFNIIPLPDKKKKNDCCLHIQMSTVGIMWRCFLNLNYMLKTRTQLGFKYEFSEFVYSNPDLEFSSPKPKTHMLTETRTYIQQMAPDQLYIKKIEKKN